MKIFFSELALLGLGSRRLMLQHGQQQRSLLACGAGAQMIYDFNPYKTSWNNLLKTCVEGHAHDLYCANVMYPSQQHIAINPGMHLKEWQEFTFMEGYWSLDTQ